MPKRERSESAQSGQDLDHLLARGRASYTARAWNDARVALTAADAREPLGCDDLERLALSTGLTGDDQGMLRVQERVHLLHVQAGRARSAARTAFWIAYRLLPLGEMGRAQGWLARAQRLVDDPGEPCAEHGLLLLPTIHRHMRAGDYTRAEEAARAACALGERFCDQ